MTFPFPLFAKFSPLKIAFYISLLLFIIFSIKYFPTNHLQEGFTQDKPFVLKENNEIYDDFYIEIYDKLTNSKERIQYDIDKIIDTTKLNKETSNILDVGCGTGVLVRELLNKDIMIRGIDKSPNMIHYTINQHHPLLQNENKDVSMGGSIFQCIEAENPIIYEMSTFSHILCLYMTIYEIKNKSTFFHNAFYGLQPNGYFVVHLVKGDSVNCSGFNGFIDLGKPKALDEKMITESGIKKLQTNFGGFTYQRDWSDIYSFKESFTDNKNKFVRQNELEWYYEPLETILQQIKSCGFILYDVIPEHSSVGGFLYFFKKIGINRVMQNESLSK